MVTINSARFPGLMLGTIFAVPVSGILAALWLRAEFDEQTGTPPPLGQHECARSKIETGLQASCIQTSAGEQMPQASRLLEGIDVLLQGSVLAAAIGLGLLGLILLAARVARGDRDTLVRVFRPCLYAILVGLTCLLLLQFAIVAYAALIVHAALNARFSLIPILSVGVISGGAAIAMIRGVLVLTRRPTSRHVGVELTPEDQPAIHAFVQGIANQIGYCQSITLIAGLKPTFFVSALDVYLINRVRTCRGHTLYLSLPMMRLLTRSELAAVIGHELAHFTAGDMAYSEKFRPMYSRLVGVLGATHRRRGHTASADLAAILVSSVLSLLLERLLVAERQVNRVRELAADKVGATVVSAPELGGALVKTSMFQPVWSPVERYAAGLIAQGQCLANMSETFAATAASDGVQRSVRNAASCNLESATLHPFDRHPPLSTRLRSLGLDPAAMIDRALQPVAQPSVTLIGGLKVLEAELSMAEQRLMADSGRVDELLAEESRAVAESHDGAAAIPA